MVGGLTSWGAKPLECVGMKSFKIKPKKINKKQNNLQEKIMRTVLVETFKWRGLQYPGAQKVLDHF